MIIDTHCHLNKNEYNNLEEVIKDLDNFIVINGGIDSETNEMVIDLANKYKNFYATIGYHPENIDNLEDNYLELLEEKLSNEKVVAIGEIGLDYHWRQDNKEKQKEVFINQLKLALKYNKPVVVHSRDAVQDTYDILKEYKVKADIHCYASSVEMAKEFIKLGCFIGVGGTVTFKNASKIVEVVSAIDLENILLETDSPYLAPEPVRGTQNIPNNTEFVIEKISQIKGINKESVICTLNNNAIKFFNIKIGD